MRKLTKIIFLILLVVTPAISFHSRTGSSIQVAAQSPEDQKLDELNKQIEEYINQIESLKQQAATLSNAIARFDAQIQLTTLQIEKTEKQILLLTGRIDQLETSLEDLSAAFSSRAVETYKMARMGDVVVFVVSAPDLANAVSRLHYLRKIQEADRELLLKLQKAQTTYEGEKDEQQALQNQLEVEQQNLKNQKSAKAKLLKDTKSSEQQFQQLLAVARAELEAIQAIIAGRGDETETGPVAEGQRIAAVIPGSSCNSSGSHLHFIVSIDGIAQNPFTYLNGGVDYENCSGSSCGSSDGDPFNPVGTWNWPISPRIEFTQGYGNTWAVRNTWVGRVYSSHNGIDISSGNAEVRSVKAGILYRGSYSGGGGCSLRYVRVDHDDSNVETFYLHVNY